MKYKNKGEYITIYPNDKDDVIVIADSSTDSEMRITQEEATL